MSDKDILAQTAYHEARGEDNDGVKAVANVIMNRAKANKSYWGGNSVSGVCKKKGQFECWNDGQNTEIKERSRYNEIKQITDRIYDGHDRHDPTGGADHYNNPSKEGYPDWTKRCKRTKTIGNHQFYETKPEFL